MMNFRCDLNAADKARWRRFGILVDRISQAIIQTIEDQREEAQRDGEDYTAGEAQLATLHAVSAIVMADQTTEGGRYWNRKAH